MITSIPSSRYGDLPLGEVNLLEQLYFRVIGSFIKHLRPASGDLGQLCAFYLPFSALMSD
jgi:hypothetical protein